MLNTYYRIVLVNKITKRRIIINLNNAGNNSSQ